MPRIKNNEKFGEVVEKLEKSWNGQTQLIEKYNGAAAVENTLTVSQKVKQSCHKVERYSTILFYSYIAKRTKN
jgi:hypothetical protein